MNLIKSCDHSSSFLHRMVAAITKSKSVSQDALKALLSSEYSDKQHVRTMTFTPEETYPSIKTLPNVAVIDVSNGKSSIVTFVNSLTHRRVMLVSVVVNSPDIMVSALVAQEIGLRRHLASYLSAHFCGSPSLSRGNRGMHK